MNRIDIIVPVYNGYDDVIKCYNSLKKHTNFDLCRVIFIDDNSPDKRILPLLKSFEDNENVIIKHNDVNQGFSANVNIGMQMSEENDVILLNSDTVVTSRWVEKIKEAAYSSEEIATVTPLSNAATLCSYPNFCEDNKIPDGMTIDSLAELIETVSLKKYPRITVAVGFCMFIKRKVIYEVGLFDAKTFGRGYGEENDFCNRAEQIGYIHVMADNTFIYHKGTASFNTEEKKQLIEAHNKILFERYPEQMAANSKYCIDNPDQYIRDNINIYRLLHNGRQTVLYLVHADFRDDCPERHGGTQYHVKDLTNGCKFEKNIIVAARESEYLTVTIYVDDKTQDFKFYIGKYDGFQKINDREIYKVLKNILIGFHVDLIHVHHVQRLSLDIFQLAQQLNIPIIMTLHDFYMICPTCKGVDSNGIFCGFVDETKCDKCLQCKRMIAPTVNWIKKWREEAYEALKICEYLITPSENCKNYFLKIYPQLKEKIKVISHGIDITIGLNDSFDCIKSENIATDKLHSFVDCCLNKEAGINRIAGWAFIEDTDSNDYEFSIKILCDGEINYYKCEKIERVDISNGFNNKKYLYSGYEATVPYAKYKGKKIEITIIIMYKGKAYTNNEKYVFKVQDYFPKSKLNVGFIGGVTVEKGTTIIRDLIQNSSNDICWYQFGEIGDEKLLKLDAPNFIKTGKYDRDDIEILLDGYGIDVVCILSCWPETFCYTLSEAFVAKKPVIGVDFGAVGERISDKYGWLVSVEHSSEEIRRILKELLNNREILENKQRNIGELILKTTEQMCVEYINLYNQFKLKKYNVENIVDYEYILQALKNSCTNARELIMKKKVEELNRKCSRLEFEINDINSTKSVKFVKNVRKILIGK